MRWLVFLGAFLLSSFARASEQSELVDCFDALRPYSQGFGESIGNWEWAPGTLYPTIAVAADRARVEGIYLYSEDQVYFADFAKVPRDQRSGWMRWFPFLLGPLRPGRGVFHCSYFSQDRVEQREIKCDLGDFLGDSRGPKGQVPPAGQKYYHPIGFKTLPATSENRGPLRTAVLSRVMSVTHGWFAKQAEKYGKALDAHKQRLASGPSALSQAAGYIGLDLDWNRNPPSPPDRDSPSRALRACAAVGDEQLAGAARTELELLRNYPLPR